MLVVLEVDDVILVALTLGLGLGGLFGCARLDDFVHSEEYIVEVIDHRAFIREQYEGEVATNLAAIVVRELDYEAEARTGAIVEEVGCKAGDAVNVEAHHA